MSVWIMGTLKWHQATKNCSIYHLGFNLCGYNSTLITVLSVSQLTPTQIKSCGVLELRPKYVILSAFIYLTRMQQFVERISTEVQKSVEYLDLQLRVMLGKPTF